jgi:hypothetical protein
MTTPNAFGFLFLGLLMLLLPSLVPHWFPPNALDGSSTSALWLGLMGWVNDGVWAWVVTRNELVPLAQRALAWRPQPLEEYVPAGILRPAGVFGTDVEMAFVTFSTRRINWYDLELSRSPGAAPAK